MNYLDASLRETGTGEWITGDLAGNAEPRAPAGREVLALYAVSFERPRLSLRQKGPIRAAIGEYREFLTTSSGSTAACSVITD
jgi:hypothetical protein